MEIPRFLQFPTLTGKNIILKQITKDDAPSILNLRGNTVAMLYIPRPLIHTMEEALAFIDVLHNKLITGEAINWAIRLKNEDTLVGNICHFNFKLSDNRSEIGYMLHPDFFRKGLMSEAIQLVLEYGFQVLNLHSTEAIIIAENIASRKLAEKAGFRLEGICKESSFHNNQYYDQCFYGLLKKEFQKEKP